MRDVLATSGGALAQLRRQQPILSIRARLIVLALLAIVPLMGLRVPKSTLIYPRVFVNNMRQINTHPGMADNLIEDNVKEMGSATRDGRSMINTGIRTVRADRSQQPPPPTGPTVTIGRVRVTNSSADASGTPAASAQ